ncbi:MAG: hypothetical protein SPF47_02520 [Gemmiger sp.]|nr:hypothetical protein [Gemmiger sp.]
MASKFGKISSQAAFETWQSAEFSTRFAVRIKRLLKSSAKYDSIKRT